MKLLRTIYRIIYTLLKLKTKLKLNSSDCDYVIWAPYFFTLRFFHGDDFPKIISTYKALKILSKNTCIYTKKDIGRFRNKTIFVIGSHLYNTYKFSNYVDILFHVVKQLENQNNTVYPSLMQIKYWENKIYMHKMFDKLDIKTPKSFFINSINELDEEDLKYPFLLKEPHSCSANGLHKITSNKDLIEASRKINFDNKIIVQELLNIKKDLRVIIVGNAIVLHYWRINLSHEWKPTSTGHGSDVDFVSFPKHWEDKILHTMKKLNLNTGAFDIAWENDDIETEPYFLEVSPFYQPNPIPDSILNDMSYGDWKKSFTFKNNYNKKLIDILFDIQNKYVNDVVR